MWPDGLVGSMTHYAGYRGAVVAPATALMGLGIDAEPHKPLRQGAWEYVALPAERDLLCPIRVTAAAERDARRDRPRAAREP